MTPYPPACPDAEAESKSASWHQTAEGQQRRLNHKSADGGPGAVPAVGEVVAGDLRKGPSPNPPRRKLKAQTWPGTQRPLTNSVWSLLGRPQRTVLPEAMASGRSRGASALCTGTAEKLTKQRLVSRQVPGAVHKAGAWPSCHARLALGLSKLLAFLEERGAGSRLPRQQPCLLGGLNSSAGAKEQPHARHWEQRFGAFLNLLPSGRDRKQ